MHQICYFLCVCVHRRYLALCVGETRVRFDLQAPVGPLLKRSHGKKSGKISVSPTTLRFLSQVWILRIGYIFSRDWFVDNISLPILFFQLLSFHVSSINVMVLNLAMTESLWHMTITGISLLLDHQNKR